MANGHTVHRLGVEMPGTGSVQSLRAASDLVYCVCGLAVENGSRGHRKSVEAGTTDGNHDSHRAGSVRSPERLSCQRRRSWWETANNVNYYSLNWCRRLVDCGYRRLKAQRNAVGTRRSEALETAAVYLVGQRPFLGGATLTSVPLCGRTQLFLYLCPKIGTPS